MRDADFITERQARSVRPARLKVGPSDDTPTGTYFADWVLAQAAESEDEESYGEREIRTTLELPLQQHAEKIIRNAGLGGSQAALVAMRTDGRVVAMVGGRDYQKNAFNRATQARRQPGSTFKLFVYLAALRNGYRPETAVDDTPLTLGDWTPQNYSKEYSGRISLADAVAKSSNVVAVRLAQRVGMSEVMRAARDLGITTPLEDNRSMPLGTAGVSLLEITSAYAAVANDAYPVRPMGIAQDQGGSWLNGWGGEPAAAQRRDPALAQLRSLLNGVVTRGTGTAANLAIPTYGKTGTTQDYRDALFIGFAGDLVVGVWVGNDNNSPLPGVTGGAAPARIWRGFMTQALNTRPAGPAAPVAAPTTDPGNAAAAPSEPVGEIVDGNQAVPVEPGEPLEPAPIPDGPGQPIPDRPVPTPSPTPPAREPERPRVLPTPERPRTQPNPERLRPLPSAEPPR
jgi:penicillin-binding protein 1A